MTEFADPYTHLGSVLSFAVFRANGAMIAYVDELVRPLGLTSARWQVLGAIQGANGSLPVAGIARNMGLVRQSVQRLADELTAEGFTEFVDNPHHRRARLVQLTSTGRTVLNEANRQWLSTANELLAEFSAEAIEVTSQLLAGVRDRLDARRREMAELACLTGSKSDLSLAQSHSARAQSSTISKEA